MATPVFCCSVQTPWCACVLSHFSHVWLFGTLWAVAHQASLSKSFCRQNTGVDCHALLQGIFLTQGSNLHLLASTELTGGFFSTRVTWEAHNYPGSVQFSCSGVSDSLQPHESQHARPPCPSPTPRVHSDSRASRRWCHPAISSSVVSFSSCPQSHPASGSFQMSQLFTSGGQNTGVLASTSVLPVNTQDWSLLGWTGWISLQSKGLSRVFSNTTVQKHQFFHAQLSS